MFVAEWTVSATTNDIDYMIGFVPDTASASGFGDIDDATYHADTRTQLWNSDAGGSTGGLNIGDTITHTYDGQAGQVTVAVNGVVTKTANANFNSSDDMRAKMSVHTGANTQSMTKLRMYVTAYD